MGSTADKVKGATNEAIGKAKQGIGEAVGSDKLQGEGVIQEIKARASRPSATPRKPPRTPSTRRPLRRTRISDRRELIGIGKTGPVGRSFCFPAASYFTPSSSTSNIRVAFGGMRPPAPRAP